MTKWLTHTIPSDSPGEVMVLRSLGPSIVGVVFLEHCRAALQKVCQFEIKVGEHNSNNYGLW